MDTLRVCKQIFSRTSEGIRVCAQGASYVLLRIGRDSGEQTSRARGRFLACVSIDLRRLARGSGVESSLVRSDTCAQMRGLQDAAAREMAKFSLLSASHYRNDLPDVAARLWNAGL